MLDPNICDVVPYGQIFTLDSIAQSNSEKFSLSALVEKGARYVRIVYVNLLLFLLESWY